MTSDSNTDSQYLGIGGKRREILDTLGDKPRLEPLDGDESLTKSKLIEALEEISIDGYMNPPTEVIDRINSAYDDLPDEAQEHYVNDGLLLSRINAARRQFEDWRGKLRRLKEMTSPVEAGPARYPTQKAERRLRSHHKGREALADALDDTKATANGAKQRALEATGSSVAEHNEGKREQTRQKKGDILEKGMLVTYRNPRLFAGKVKRVNRKSVRIKRPNPRAGQEKRFDDGVEPEFREARIDLDSSHLTPLLEDSDLDDLQTITNVDTDTVDEIEDELFD